MASETDYLDSFFQNFDANRMERILKEAQRQAQIAESMLEAYWGWRAAQRDNIVVATVHTPKSSTATPNGDSPTGRKSVAALINAGPDSREWTIPSIAQALGLGRDAHHAIGVSVSRLARDNEIARPRKGIYTKLPSETVPAAEGGDQEARLDTGSQLGAG